MGLGYSAVLRNAAVGRPEAPVRTGRNSGDSQPRFSPEIGFVVVLFLASAFFRFYHLDASVPGLLVDTGISGLDMQQILNGHPQLYFPDPDSREALFMYWGAFLLKFGGQNLFVLGFAATALGILTIALTYQLFKALFGWRVALPAAALLSASFWFVDLARFYERPISLPLFAVLTVYLLWKTLQTGSWGKAVLTGLSLGLSQYTYPSARFLAILTLLLCAASWRQTRARLPQVGVAGALALIVFLPEAAYFFLHPGVTLLRIGQVSIFNPDPALKGAGTTPLQGFINVGKAFFIRGDENLTFNVPGRPFFDPLLAPVFVAGLALCLLRCSRSRYRWMIVWLVVMSLPGALSLESPNSSRLLGMAPVTFFFPGLTLGTLLSQTRSRLVAAAVALVLVFSHLETFDLYFLTWSNNPETYWNVDGNEQKIATFIAGRAEKQLYFSDETGPAIRFLLPATQESGWFQEENTALPLPRQITGDILYTFNRHAASSSLALSWLPGAQALSASVSPDGQPDFSAVRWPADDAHKFMAAQLASNADFSPDFRLASYESTSLPGRIVLNLVWQQIQAAGPYDIYVHLLDANGRLVSQQDRLVWPIKNIFGPLSIDQAPLSQDLILTQHSLAAVPGSYVAEIGVGHRLARDRSQLTGRPIKDAVHLPVVIPG